MMFALAFIFSASLVQAQSTAPAVPIAETPDAVTPAANAPAGTNTDYEVDYEEDPADAAAGNGVPADEASSKNTGKTAKKSRGKSDGRFEGTRSQNKFQQTPVMPTTKSQYKKNGVPLDVDSD